MELLPELIIGVFCEAMGCKSATIVEVASGNINTILKIQAEGRFYGFRMRVQEAIYRYEPLVMKEALLAELFALGPRNHGDELYKSAISKVEAKGRPAAASTPQFPFPRLRWWDWTRKSLPHPFCIYEWGQGACLWDAPSAAVYRQAGHWLAKLHEYTFDGFYPNLLELGGRATPWGERFEELLAIELGAAASYLPNKVLERLSTISLPESPELVPTLLHDDYSGANILVRDGEIASVIDWDNAVIDMPQLDFVKMKYWTARGPDGVLTHNSELYTAFQAGYAESGKVRGRAENQQIMGLHELLWLCRVFNFEKSKEERGLPCAKGYPSARFYEQALCRIGEMNS